MAAIFLFYQKYVDIDIYGKCGSLKCHKSNKSCTDVLNTYKFYLAFENSFCTDYVTEKFFRCFEPNGPMVIPVVRGGIDYAKYFPPKTFIDTKDFKNAKELALFLKELANDIPKYVSYLKEKDKLIGVNYKTDWCEVCEALHTHEDKHAQTNFERRRRLQRTIISDIRSVTHPKDICWHRNDIFGITL